MCENKKIEINTLSVETKIHTLTWDEEIKETQEYVEYFIDGKSLRKILTEVNGDNDIDFEESFIGVYPSDFFFPSKNFLGEAETALIEEDGSRIILICSTCGVLMCRDVVFELEEKDDFVIWKNFKKPIYDNKYMDLNGGPFVFKRDEYESVLRGEMESSRD